MMRHAFVLFMFSILFSCQKTVEYRIAHNSELNTLANNALTFSWKIETEEIKEQTAYQIKVYAGNKNDSTNSNIIWDSGKVESKLQSFSPYLGEALKGGQVYYSKVKVWDENNNESKWSTPKKLIAPLKYPEDWSGKWITYSYKPEDPLPLFRKNFSIKDTEKIDFVSFYIAAPSFYEAYINGKRIGENVLDPAQTNFNDYMFYTAYDIPMEQLKAENVLGVMLGNGWYNQNVVWGKSMIYGQPIVMGQLQITYKDGRKKTISTDTSWQWTAGPITYTNIYTGEYYDARKEVANWSSSLENNAQWQNATLAEKHPNKVLEQFAEPIQVMDSIMPVKIASAKYGNYIYDFGQNITGWVKLQVEGEKGQEITIRFSEEMGKDGELDFRSTGIKATKNIQTEKYICKGEGVEIWEPRFTYHGFRYAEVSGLTSKPSKDLLTGMIVYSAMEKTGSFNSSEPHINKLHQLTLWTLKGNMQGIPTDCPHREKCGWTGDSHAVAKTLIHNLDAHQFLTKYVYDMRSSGRNEKKELYFGRNFHDRSIITKPKGITTMIAPGRRTSGTASPDWGTAVVQLPWYIYTYYGDKSILEAFYKDMTTWVDYVGSKKENGVIVHGLGDWCPPDGNASIECPVPVSSTAYHILDVSILRKTAKVLGYKDDEKKYELLENQLKASFNNAFLDKQKGTYGSQTANSMALEIGITPEAYKTKVAKAIVEDSNANHNGFLSTGIFGVSRVFQALSENGYEDKAYQLLTKKGNHSFEAMWAYYDATTLWEILPVNTNPEEYDKLMLRSHSHPMQGGFDSWFYSGIAGINPDENEPGFKKVIFKPYLTQQMEHAQASYESRYGVIKSAWKNKAGIFSWEIQIPKNSTGDVYVPNYGKEVSITINGEALNNLDLSSQFTNIGSFSSGNYIIEMKYL
ncbi:family 78 glycoside hydrolase catalytic domain [Algibacter miyuki]|uniref:alpha-L-rhamnosidase n=1 Tax=Algibacter miyuki TaxID=1306933 RepID=A0ABV5H4H3_9FLAO|nr:alpha-L-rhamnosidase [Algibacter miyuki]MDN3664026.1 family 78 glycoside hydrolase catalytic domain [Algibacter miyuki]